MGNNPRSWVYKYSVYYFICTYTDGEKNLDINYYKFNPIISENPDIKLAQVMREIILGYTPMPQ